MAITQRPRVLLLIPHLGGGGAEKVISLLARGLSPERYELHLGLVTQTGAGAESIPSWVHIHALGAARVRGGAFKLLRLIRQLKPDVILSGMFHLNFLVLLLRILFPRGTRILIRQNGTVSAALAFGNLPAYTRFLYQMLYGHADRVICQTSGMAKDLTAELGIGMERLVVLPNPLDVVGIRDAIAKSPDLWTGPGPHLLAVGRLSREKGFDLLLCALAALRKEIPQADVAIAGIGPEETALKAQCRDLGLEAAVCFAGHVAHPSVYFPGASVFVLSSRHEGLPNALLEAAAGGLPLVALPVSEGVTDLLRDQPGAWLAPEVSADALANSLLEALKSLSPGQRFEHPFVEGFRIERAIRAYENLIDTVLAVRTADERTFDAKVKHARIRERCP